MPSPSESSRLTTPCYLLQRLRRTEQDDLHPRPDQPTSGALLDTLIVDQLAIHPPDSAGIVRVTYFPRRPTYLSYARDHTGAYRPGGQEALALQLGESGRARYNWRHVSHDDSWYDQWDVNIGWFARLQLNALLEAPPIKVYSRLSPLW